MSLDRKIVEAYKAIENRSETDPRYFLEKLEAVAKIDPRFDINMEHPRAGGRTLFAHASMFGRVKIMDELHHLGADINIVTPVLVEDVLTIYPGFTPLHYAALKGRASAVAWLLAHGVNPDDHQRNTQLNEDENVYVPDTPLELASKYPKVVTLLKHAIIKRRRANATRRRRHLLAARLRPENRPESVVTESNNKNANKIVNKSEGRGAGAGAGATRRKSHNNE